MVVTPAVLRTGAARGPGLPERDADSARHTAAIDGAASKDADPKPSPFAERLWRAAERFGFGPPTLPAERMAHQNVAHPFTPISLHARLKRSIVVDSKVAGDSFDG